MPYNHAMSVQTQNNNMAQAALQAQQHANQIQQQHQQLGLAMQQPGQTPGQMQKTPRLGQDPEVSVIPSRPSANPFQS